MKRLGVAFACLFAIVVNAQGITGKFVDRTQTSISNVVVELLPVGADWITRSTHTESDGTFRLSAGEPGKYVIIARGTGFQSRILTTELSAGQEINVGTRELRIGSCDTPGTNCDYIFGGAPIPPPVPVVDLCEALQRLDRYGNRPIVVVGRLTTVRGWPALIATCDTALSSGGLVWINAVLLPEGAVPQKAPTFPDVPDLKKKLADLAAAVRKTSGLPTSRVAAVYGFLDIPDGLQAVPCSGDFCTHPDIGMPPASLLRVDGFEELK